MLTPCLAAPCLWQSNTPRHVVCFHGSNDPSHSVHKNTLLVPPPTSPPHTEPTHTHTYPTPPTADELGLKSFFISLCVLAHAARRRVENADGLTRRFLEDARSAMLFEITLTVIGRPQTHAADTRGVEIRNHLVLQSKQQHNSFPLYPPLASLQKRNSIQNFVSFKEGSILKLLNQPESTKSRIWTKALTNSKQILKKQAKLDTEKCLKSAYCGLKKTK